MEGFEELLSQDYPSKLYFLDLQCSDERVSSNSPPNGRDGKVTVFTELLPHWQHKYSVVSTSKLCLIVAFCYELVIFLLCAHMVFWL